MCFIGLSDLSDMVLIAYPIRDFAGRDLICSIDLHRVQKHSETRSNAHTPTIRPHTPSQGRGKSPELGHDYAQPARPSTSLDRRTCTDLVVGSRVIQSSVIDLHGQKVLVFVFSVRLHFEYSSRLWILTLVE